MSETELSMAIRHTLERINVVVWRSQSGVISKGARFIHMAPAGTPDLLGYLPGGRMLALEIKRPGQKPSPAQEAWRARAVGAGVVAAVVTSAQEAVDVVRTATLPCELVEAPRRLRLVPNLGDSDK